MASKINDRTVVEVHLNSWIYGQKSSIKDRAIDKYVNVFRQLSYSLGEDQVDRHGDLPGFHSGKNKLSLHKKRSPFVEIYLACARSFHPPALLASYCRRRGNCMTTS